jgi:hypothetical protein
MFIVIYNSDIDPFLDEYNDYITLYKMFRDKEYLEVADGIMSQLRECLNDII